MRARAGSQARGDRDVFCARVKRIFFAIRCLRHKGRDHGGIRRWTLDNARVSPDIYLGNWKSNFKFLKKKDESL